VSIYIPRHFVGDDATGRELMAQHPFATMVTTTPAGPRVTHLPLLLDETGTALVGHVARPNPHWQAFAGGRTVAIFHGPHAFVSRGWYRDPAANVPTWNYATVHVSTGPVHLADADETRAAVLDLARRFEPPGLPPIGEEKLAKLFKGLVAFRLPIERLEVKLKMSQNKPEEMAGVVAGLRATGGTDELATLRWMETHGNGGQTTISRKS
jgi:transcriptional regulator